jgi:hypothetical protein
MKSHDFFVRGHDVRGCAYPNNVRMFQEQPRRFVKEWICPDYEHTPHSHFFSALLEFSLM